MKSANGKPTPSLPTLAAYDAVARHGSITAAARELNLTQSAVSKQLADLQQFLGVALLHRAQGRLVCTYAGEQYLSRVRPALAELEDATLELLATRGDGGRLNLSVPATFGNMWLMPRLAGFARTHPHIVVNLSTKIGPVALPSAQVHAAIMYMTGPVDEGLHAEHVWPVTLYPVCAPAALADFGSPESVLARLPLLHQGSTPQAWPGYAAARGLPASAARGGPRYALLSMGLQAALSGLGVALLPDYVIQDSLARGSLARLDDRPYRMDGDYRFVCPSGQRDAPVIAAFAAWLRGEIAVAGTDNAAQRAAHA